MREVATSGPGPLQAVAVCAKPISMFPDEDHCAAYLEALRWPDGFACRYCGVVGEPYRFANRPEVFVTRGVTPTAPAQRRTG